MVLAANIFPSILAKQAIKGREYVTRAFTHFYEAGHQNEASALVKFRYEHIAIKHKITNPEDNARFEVAGAFSVISNTIPVIFWVVFQIYSDPVVLRECREEVSRIIEDTNGIHSLDIKRLKDSSPVLQSTVYEVLRFHSILQSFREVLDDCLINGEYLLKKKGLVILPAANAHFDKSVWGEDANIFNHKRFIETGVGRRRMGFRGFGGGQVLCPGRHFAMTEILSFVALMILQYDAKPTSNTWGGVNYSKNPLTGAAYLAPEKDVEVLLRRRLSKKVAVVLTGSDDGMEMMEENTMDEEKFH